MREQRTNRRGNDVAVGIQMCMNINLAAHKKSQGFTHNTSKVWYDYFKVMCSNRWPPVTTRHKHFTGQQSSSGTTITVVSHPPTEMMLSIIVTRLEDGSKPQCDHQRDILFCFFVFLSKQHQNIEISSLNMVIQTNSFKKTQCALRALLWLAAEITCGITEYNVTKDRCVLMWTEAICSLFEGLHRDILISLSLSAR